MRIVVAYTAGGALDNMTRVIASQLTNHWRQPVVVENQPGSSTFVGSELVAKSSPDGYTLMMTADPTMTVNPHTFKRMPYDPVRDFSPVTLVVDVPLVLVANSSVGASNFAGLVALAKRSPGKLNYGSYGTASPPQLVIEVLKLKSGMDIVHVSYKGGAETIPATIAGHIQVSLASIPSVLSHAKAGRLRMLAWGGRNRSSLIPEVLTFAEQGYPEVPARSWYGIVAPAGTPRSIVSYIHREVVEIFNDPALRQRESIEKGFDLVLSSPDEFAAFLRGDLVNRGEAVKAAGIIPQ